MKVKTNILSFILLFFFTSVIISQNNISGEIVNEKGEPVLGAAIIISGLKKGASSDLDGNFIIKNIATKKFVLEVSSIGYISRKINVNFNEDNQKRIKIVLKEDTTVIEEVSLRTKTKTEAIEQKSYSIKSIDVSKLKNKTTNLTEVLNNVSGVRIRSAGAVGSGYEVSLNGLSGNQIRIFVDDIPIDDLGDAFNLNNIALNLIERIDVYKGIVPVKLGADALGGAINIITDKNKNSYLDASYSIGSFNTHKAVLNGKYRNKKNGFTVNASGVYNYSDNDFTLYDVEYFNIDDEEVINDVDLFHANYKAISGNIELGFTKTKWVDEFLININKVKIDEEQQGTINRPLGEATGEENNTNAIIRFKKSDLFNDKLKIDLYAMYNDLSQVEIDTTDNRYKWDGSSEVTQVLNGFGEYLIPKSVFVTNQQLFQSRINLDYEISDNHNISFNHIYSDISNESENRYNIEDSQEFNSPSFLKKIVTGIEYTGNFFDNKLQTVLSGKYYNFNILAKEAITFTDGSIGINDIETLETNFGYSFSSRYFITPRFYAKASFEKGYRIPTSEEIFGDGLSSVANPFLQPESSNNLNLGLSHTLNTNKGYLKNNVNAYQRDAKNFIATVQGGLFTQSLNTNKVLIQGLEWDGTYKLNNFSVNASFTWQKKLNNEDFEDGSIEEEIFEKQQLPNEPILFGNIYFKYKIPKLFKNIQPSFYYGINYVDEFYLGYEKLANLNPDKNTIPTQFLNNIGATFSTKDKKHNISIDVRNVFNELAFDNFREQKPGRAFYFKYRFYIDN